MPKKITVFDRAFFVKKGRKGGRSGNYQLKVAAALKASKAAAKLPHAVRVAAGHKAWAKTLAKKREAIRVKAERKRAFYGGVP